MIVAILKVLMLALLLATPVIIMLTSLLIIVAPAPFSLILIFPESVRSSSDSSFQFSLEFTLLRLLQGFLVSLLVS